MGSFHLISTQCISRRNIFDSAYVCPKEFAPHKNALLSWIESILFDAFFWRKFLIYKIPIPIFFYFLQFLPIVSTTTTKQQTRCSWGCSRNTVVINSFIHSLIESFFCSESSRHCLYQTVTAVGMKVRENVNLPPCILCYLSCVTCHKPGVTYQVSRVTCQVSHVRCHLFCYWQVGGSSCWRV